MATVNNNAAYSVLQGASAQRLGTDNLATITLQDIVDSATTWTDVEKEQWAGSLSAQYVKTYYTDSTYDDKSNDIFFEDEATFGAVSQIINIELPDIIENRSWTAVTAENGKPYTINIGSNTAYVPIVNEQLYAGTDSWGVSVAYTGTQLNSAFQSVTGLLQFNNYVQLVAQNAIKYHKATMNSLNRNNYIAEKLNAKNSTGTINYVNLVAEYCNDTNTSTMTAQAYLNNADCLRHAAKTISKYKSLLLDMTTLFYSGSDKRGKFVPYDRLAFQLLSDFEGRMNSVMMSNTFHTEYVDMPLYRTVNAWQSLTNTDATAQYDTLSAINVTTANGNSVDQSGIIGLMCDKWAIMHTMVQNRVGYQRDDIKDISMYDYQFTDRYVNNLILPGVVFVVESVTG